MCNASLPKSLYPVRLTSGERELIPITLHDDYTYTRLVEELETEVRRLYPDMSVTLAAIDFAV